MSGRVTSSDDVHHLIADTDVLIAYGRLECWDVVQEWLNITTTQKCYNELSEHTNPKPGERYASEAKARKAAAECVLGAINSEHSGFNWTYCGESVELGEHSIPLVVEQHADRVDAILMMDKGRDDRQEGGRAYVKRKLNLKALGVTLPSIGVPLARLAQADVLSEDAACAAINEVTEKEGWRSRGALRRVWRDVPLECDETPSFIAEE